MSDAVADAPSNVNGKAQLPETVAGPERHIFGRNVVISSSESELMTKLSLLADIDEIQASFRDVAVLASTLSASLFNPRKARDLRKKVERVVDNRYSPAVGSLPDGFKKDDMYLDPNSSEAIEAAKISAQARVAQYSAQMAGGLAP